MTNESETYKAIEDRILALLNTPEGRIKIRLRQKEIAEVARSRPCWKENRKSSDHRLVRREKVWFTATQGYAQDKRGYTLNVEMLGKNIGVLKLVKVEGKLKWQFQPEKDYEPNGGPWLWSHDAKSIRDFLGSCAKRFAGTVWERELQWQLAHAIDNAELFERLAVMKWLGYPTEIGVSITREGKLGGTGTIDLLVRRRGGNQGAQFIVLDAKRHKERCVCSALKQTIYYALALSVEANESNETIKNYRTAFSFGRGDAPLKFGAAIVMENTPDNRKQGEECLTRLKPPHGAKVDRLGMLLYNWENGKATSWTWLDGWDPRKPA